MDESKKKLIVGVVAAILLMAGLGALKYYQDNKGLTPATATAAEATQQTPNAAPAGAYVDPYANFQAPTNQQ